MLYSLLLSTGATITANTGDIHTLKDFADPMYGDKGLVILLVICLLAFLGMYILAEYLFRFHDSRKYMAQHAEDIKSREDLATAIMKLSDAMDGIKDEVADLGTKIDGMSINVTDLKRKMDGYEQSAAEQKEIIDSVLADMGALKDKVDSGSACVCKKCPAVTDSEEKKEEEPPKEPQKKTRAKKN